MNIIGMLVHVNSIKIKQVEQSLMKIGGIEVHAVTEKGQLIITIEENDDQILTEKIFQLHHLEGVLAAAIVYQYSETQGDIEDEAESA